jgi:hypothetical protein
MGYGMDECTLCGGLIDGEDLCGRCATLNNVRLDRAVWRLDRWSQTPDEWAGGWL